MKCMSLIKCKSNSTDNTPSRSWDPKEYKYKIEESKSDGEVNELDQYVFVVRVRIGEYRSCKPSFTNKL
jgi:hypothetical protein